MTGGGANRGAVDPREGSLVEEVGEAEVGAVRVRQGVQGVLGKP